MDMDGNEGIAGLANDGVENDGRLKVGMLGLVNQLLVLLGGASPAASAAAGTAGLNIAGKSDLGGGSVPFSSPAPLAVFCCVGVDFWGEE